VVVERMNELSVMVDFVYSSCHRGVALLGGATSSSMIRGDSETECLFEKPDDGAFDDHVF
jgi:hypothetical protein